MPSGPTLYLHVGTLRSGGVYAYSTLLELKQRVQLLTDPTITAWVPTWRATSHIGIVGSGDLSSVREMVRDMVDQFINAYLAANPKR